VQEGREGGRSERSANRRIARKKNHRRVRSEPTGAVDGCSSMRCCCWIAFSVVETLLLPVGRVEHSCKGAFGKRFCWKCVCAKIGVADVRSRRNAAGVFLSECGAMEDRAPPNCDRLFDAITFSRAEIVTKQTASHLLGFYSPSRDPSIENFWILEHTTVGRVWFVQGLQPPIHSRDQPSSFL